MRGGGRLVKGGKERGIVAVAVNACRFITSLVLTSFVSVPVPVPVRESPMNGFSAPRAAIGRRSITPRTGTGTGTLTKERERDL